jgi:hypothetical protein
MEHLWVLAFLLMQQLPPEQLLLPVMELQPLLVQQLLFHQIHIVVVEHLYRVFPVVVVAINVRRLEVFVEQWEH